NMGWVQKLPRRQVTRILIPMTSFVRRQFWMRSPKSNRICVLGDSHVVALRRALGRDPANLAGLDITLVASARDGMNNTRLAGSRLEATTEKIADQFIRTSGGKPYVDLANYDYLA